MQGITIAAIENFFRSYFFASVVPAVAAAAFASVVVVVAFALRGAGRYRSFFASLYGFNFAELPLNAAEATA